MAWHKWHRAKRWVWGATKRDRQREQRRRRRHLRQRIDCSSPKWERVWERWDVWNYD